MDTINIDAEFGLSLCPDAAWLASALSLSRPKMDSSKALSILGFSSGRSLDGRDPVSVLKAALCRRMEEAERAKRRQAGKAAGHAGTRASSSAILANDYRRDDARVLHEAYQFLVRRYARREADSHFHTEEDN